MSNDKIQQTQEALVRSHARTISALRDSLKELHAQGLIRPFRVSLAVSQEQEQQIQDLHNEGKSVRQIAAKVGVAKSAVSARTKKPSNSIGKSVRADRPTPVEFAQAIEAAQRVAEYDVTEEIVSAADAVAQAWRKTADLLARQLKGDTHG